jgi:hypothetical protein
MGLEFDARIRVAVSDTSGRLDASWKQNAGLLQLSSHPWHRPVSNFNLP